MFRQMVHRIAMFTAIAGVTAGINAPCKADLTLNTPAGLTPGDTFRFVFVTPGTTSASSSNIADYDNFVTSLAGGATYNGVTVTWQAIVSTTTVNAIDHLGVNSGISGVYLANGTLVASGDGTSGSGIWSGSLLAPIDRDLAGDVIDYGVWTGTNYEGIAFDPVGEPGVGYGYSTYTSSDWVYVGTFGDQTIPLCLYAMSGVLTVPSNSSVPEPSSLIVAAFAGTVGLVLAWSRKGKAPARQGPMGTTDESQQVSDA